MSREFAVILPIKPPAVGKSRIVGLSDDARRLLAEAFALDTAQAVATTEGVTGVLAVTDDFRFAGRLRELGCDVIPDATTTDLNHVLVQAASDAARRWPRATPVVVCADLPSLQPVDLAAVLDALPADAAAYVPDADGTGTTLYSAPAEEFAPQFGHDSARAHQESGAVAVGLAAEGVRRDVDDLADLDAALRLGVGSRTLLALDLAGIDAARW